MLQGGLGKAVRLHVPEDNAGVFYITRDDLVMWLSMFETPEAIKLKHMPYERV